MNECVLCVTRAGSVREARQGGREGGGRGGSAYMRLEWEGDTDGIDR